MTYSCEALSPVAVHTAAGTTASTPDDSLSAGSGAKNKVLVGEWVDLHGPVFHRTLTHLALI